MAQGVTQMVDDGNDEPIEQLQELMERARQLEIQHPEEVAADDPIEKIEAFIERARRLTEGEGAEALRRLEDRIERAKWIPQPHPYQPPQGDPLEALEARLRGEEPEQVTGGEAVEGPLSSGGGTSAVSAETGGRSPGDRHRRMGQSLEASLRGRPLPGPVRAEVAARLAAMLREEESSELRELWELVVFGGNE